MKKTLLCFALALMAVACTTANDKTFTMKGDLKNAGDTLVVMSLVDRNWRDTIVLTDGKFEKTFSLDTVTGYYLMSATRPQNGQGLRMQIVAVPGETLELVGDATDKMTFGGTKFYQEYNQVDGMLENAQQEMKEFTEGLMKMLEQGVPQDSVVRLYQASVEPMQQKVENTIMDYIKAHPDMEAAATLVTQVSPERMAEAAGLLADKVKNGRMKTYYQVFIDRIEAEKKAEEASAMKQAEGVEAPDFTLNDLKGKPLKLSSLRGKYVILDFWGSWCGWCIKGIPQMKEYYKKYAGKFEILGIDCNDTPEKWMAAVKEHQLPWLHVYNTKESSVLEEYGIQGFPTKIIVSPEGKIVKTIVGEDPAFYTLLDELFGK